MFIDDDVFIVSVERNISMTFVDGGGGGGGGCGFHLNLTEVHRTITI